MNNCTNNLMLMNVTESCDCKGNGTCRNDRCICDEGFFGNILK